MSQRAVDDVKEKLGAALIESYETAGDHTLVVKKEKVGAVVDHLKQNLHFDFLADVTGNDYPERADRFEVVYHLMSTKSWERIALRVPLPAKDPKVESMAGRYKLANWFERETYDMFGITFTGHPDLRRLLCHRDFPGHPLRKDFPKEFEPPIFEPVPIDEQGIVKQHRLEDGTDTVVINFGPAHPITHGVIRCMWELDGETIRHSDTEIGYLHRCMEKESEATNWDGVIPYCDRLNYCSTQMNTMGYAMAVEKLVGLEITERAKLLRVILAEVNRILDHVVCLGPNIIDIGALTPYWYLFKVREAYLDVHDRLAGSRMTASYVRIGGFAKDVYDGFADDLRAAKKLTQEVFSEVRGLVEKNRIFLDRTVGVGIVSRADAISWGLTGPMGRASGLAYDVRKQFPYYHYDELDWEVVVGTAGDTHDRIMCRFEEVDQSLAIIDQALDLLPPGPVNVERPELIKSPHSEVYSNIEALAGHFMHVIYGPKVPKGDAYGFSEAANGELGFYIVSDGSGSPQRVHVRAPCLAAMQSFDRTVEGHMIADASAILGSLNIIAGELDR